MLLSPIKPAREASVGPPEAALIRFHTVCMIFALSGQFRN